MNTSNMDTAFFGHPRGLSTLFFTETWERFSYYGMRAILLFYMYYAVSKGGLGINQTTAASIMAIYGSMVYLSSVVGGWLADRLWGARRTVLYGGILIMFGHIALSLPFAKGALFASIGLIVVGTGLLKPNISDMVGGLYSETDRRRDAGFSIYLFGINLGAAIAPWAVPWAASGFGLHLFGNQTNFHAGFSLAAFGMFLGLVQYMLDGKKYLSKDSLYPNDPLTEQRTPIIAKSLLVIGAFIVLLLILAAFNQLNITNLITIITIIAIALPLYYFVWMLNSKKVTLVEKKRVVAYITLFISAVIFWIIDESGSVVLALFAEQRTILHLGSWHFAAANFQTLNPLFMMLLTPLFATLWDHLKKRPSAPVMFVAALVFAGLSYAFMALPGLIYGTTAGRVSPFWLVGSWFIVELGEVSLSPVGLSITSHLAPQAFKSQMMSMYFLADAAGQAVNAQIVKFYSSATEVSYFLTIGAISIGVGIILLFFAKPINRLITRTTN